MEDHLKFHILQLLIASGEVVARQVADEAIRLHDAGFVPLALVIISVQALGQLGVWP